MKKHDSKVSLYSCAGLVAAIGLLSVSIAEAEVTVLAGREQATTTLDAQAGTAAFNYSRQGTGGRVDTYVGSYLMCANPALPAGAPFGPVEYWPRYQTADAAAYVWMLPHVYLETFNYAGASRRIDVASNGTWYDRCLTARPYADGSGAIAWTAARGLFTDSFDAYTGSAASSRPNPTAPYQNARIRVKGWAPTNPFASDARNAYVVEVTVDYDYNYFTGDTVPMDLSVVDAYNDSVYSSAQKDRSANWCKLPGGTTLATDPRPNLCQGMSGQGSGAMVSIPAAFALGGISGSQTSYYLVTRPTPRNNDDLAAPIQAFAVLVVNDQAEPGRYLPVELLDWNAEDSVWFGAQPQ